MKTNGAVATAGKAGGLVRTLKSARKVAPPARQLRNSGAPRSTADAFKKLLAANRRMARELKQLHSERREVLRTLKAVEQGDFTARALVNHNTGEVAQSLNN
ncbi:MAG: hypothetical protein HY293_19300, partial [Planctomycetes bacterium]|nr:hypothetical protein [Planctomycetota bacterium]